MKRKRTLIPVAILCLSVYFAPARADEKEPSAQVRYDGLSEMAIPEAFELLKTGKYTFDDMILAEGVRQAFAQRREQAIRSALNILRAPRIKIVDGRKVSQADDFRVAKQVFRQFPAESLEILEKEYRSSDVVLKSNIIQMAWAADPGRRSEHMLIEALEDTAFCEDEYPGDEGIPMRVCDVAYNQLVLIWQIRDVLRTIGVIHRIDTRDYHIGILKGKINDYRRL